MKKLIYSVAIAVGLTATSLVTFAAGDSTSRKRTTLLENAITSTTLFENAKTDPLVNEIINKISQVSFKNTSNNRLMKSIYRELAKRNVYWDITTEFQGWTDRKDIYLSKNYGTPENLARTIAHEAGHNVYPRKGEQAFVDTLTEWKVSAAIGYPNQYFKLNKRKELVQLMQYP